jgi:hypothetical protein
MKSKLHENADIGKKMVMRKKRRNGVKRVPSTRDMPAEDALALSSDGQIRDCPQWP